MDHWLSVVEYAAHKKISVSTLRRRIKAQSVEFKLENGKYFIKAEIEEKNTPPILKDIKLDSDESSTLTIETIQELFAELKRAYGLVLTEKEELIQQLKSENDILKQMNQFLEKEILKDSPPYQHALDNSL